MLDFKSSSVTHGIWRIIDSDYVTEIAAQTGFNFQIFDREHGALDFNAIERGVRICSLANCLPLVRASGLNQTEVQRSLDIGAAGIVFPQLKNYSDFLTASRMTRYAPQGTRGFNPFTRAGGYGVVKAPEIFGSYCIPIIETNEAIQEIDEIVTIDGIDIFYIGAYDLSVQLGCPGKMDDPHLLKVIQQLIERIHSKGKKTIVLVRNKIQLETYLALGISIFVHSVDANLIAEKFTETLQRHEN